MSINYKKQWEKCLDNFLILEGDIYCYDDSRTNANKEKVLHDIAIVRRTLYDLTSTIKNYYLGK